MDVLEKDLMFELEALDTTNCDTVVVYAPNGFELNNETVEGLKQWIGLHNKGLLFLPKDISLNTENTLDIIRKLEASLDAKEVTDEVRA